MHYSYRDPKTDGILNLLVRTPDLSRRVFQPSAQPVHTLAWNQGADQRITIDGIDSVFPAQTIVPLVLNQSFTFERPQDVIAWQFDREFYCIVDHDKEVSCVGFLFYGIKIPLFLRLSPAEQTKFSALLLVFDDEFSTHDTIQGEMLRMLLKRLIIKLTRLAKEQYLSPAMPTHDYDLIRQFNLLLEIHFRSLHAVSQYADLLNRSPKTLANLFALYNQPAPLQSIHRRIALEAKRLLLFTDKSTKEIAYALGFTEVSHFSRFFKNQAGLSPSDFREQRSIATDSGKN